MVIARVGVAVEAISFADLQQLVFGRAADALDHLRHIARVMLLQQVVDAARMLQRRIDLGKTVGADLVVPAGFVVAMLVGVVS